MLLFAFSIPIEAIIKGGEESPTLARFTGYVLLAAALTAARTSLSQPSPALGFFAAYLAVTAILGLTQGGPEEYWTLTTAYLLQRGQLVVMLWIVSGSLRHPQLAVQSVLAYALGASVLAAFVVAESLLGGVPGTRASTFGEDPNALGGALALGALALATFRRRAMAAATRSTMLLLFCLIAYGLVLTGSRGAVIVFLVGMAVLALEGGSLRRRAADLASLAALAGAVAAFMYASALADRWTVAIESGDLSFRDLIYASATDMFLEHPLTGWGPGAHLYELAMRAGTEAMGHTKLIGTHNVLLWALTSTGLVGTIPFVGGLWWCVRSAWRGRSGALGMGPLAMIAGALAFGMSVDADRGKAYWFFLALAAAAPKAFSVSAGGLGDALGSTRSQLPRPVQDRPRNAP
ncbi:MAG: O-antigen ligase family protein [Anaeromyxobacteraceae bacterium]|nr:O-antigen ligase family protein [Anaeromyxobacteraceae bacterium]